MKGKIEISKMEFFAFHGCHESERIVGNNFMVDAILYYDCSKAATSDQITDALNYQLVYAIISKEMAQPSNLLEHLVKRIIDALRANFPELEKVIIKVAKQNPPLGGKIGSTSLEIED